MASGYTYPKPLKDLLSLLDEHKANLFRNAINTLPTEHQVVLKCTLAHLEDSKWNALVVRLTSASSEQIRHYVNILGCHYSAEPQRKPTIRIQNPREATSTVSDLSGSSLRAGLAKLPVELRNQIIAAFIESTLSPDFIFPDQQPGPNGLFKFRGNVYHPPKYDVLLGLNRANYKFHGSMFWENYFVLGRGPAAQSMQWLHRMAPDIRAKLRNVYINLDTADLDLGTAGTNAECMAYTCYQQGTFEDPVELMGEFDLEADRHGSRLLELWCEKVGELCDRGIWLKSLVIDVRDAYGIDGRFLGDWFMSTVPRFGKRRPENVRVLAGSVEVAERLKAMFYERNDETWRF